MRSARVWRAFLGVEKTVVEDIEFNEGAELLVAHVRPTGSARGRCGICRRRCPGYDGGVGRRRWRALDLGTMRAVLEADAPRVACPDHGVVVVAVPWARHGAGHTFAFDEHVAWLAVQTSKTAVGQLMRVAWRTVGAIVTRVAADAFAGVDRFAGLRRIGVDEIAYKRGYRYLTVVVDHDTRRLIWAAPGREKATLHRFFDALGEDRCARITHVSADAADWIRTVVTARCPQAVRCADPFHVVKWATDALDQVRRDAWNAARASKPRDLQGSTTDPTARALKKARYALWKNPDRITTGQRQQLDWIAKTDPRVYRAYLLKEGLRYVFATKGDAATEALDRWLAWARRCRIPQFVDVAHKITSEREAIDNALRHGLSNGLIESTNAKIRLLTRIAYGFTSPDALIALAMLHLGGHRPALPGRTHAA
ncbi:MAG: ISL3 family transposase [Actinomycetes bacterium]